MIFHDKLLYRISFYISVTKLILPCYFSNIINNSACMIDAKVRISFSINCFIKAIEWKWHPNHIIIFSISESNRLIQSNCVIRTGFCVILVSYTYSCIFSQCFLFTHEMFFQSRFSEKLQYLITRLSYVTIFIFYSYHYFKNINHVVCFSWKFCQTVCCSSPVNGRGILFTFFRLSTQFRNLWMSTSMKIILIHRIAKFFILTNCISWKRMQICVYSFYFYIVY